MSKKVTFTFGCGDDSGAGRMGYYFSREFVRCGWSVSAICPKPPPGSVSVIERLEEIGVSVDLLLSMSGSLDPRIISRFVGHLERYQPNVVVSIHQQDMKFAGLAARRVGLPYVVSGQNTLTFSGGRLKQKLSSLILGGILNNSCSAVVATSDRVANDFRKILGFRGEVCLQPNGVDTASLVASGRQRDQMRNQLGYSKGDFVITSVGRITNQKNQIGLVNAFQSVAKKHQNAHLLLVGGVTQGFALEAEDRSYMETVCRRINEIGLEKRVTITGWRRDVPDLLAAADLYVQNSLWEGSPLAVVEAMASGLPIVIADNGGVLPRFRHGEHGWIISVDKTKMLETALGSALTMPLDELRDIGRCAQQLACSCYDSNIVSRNFLNIVARCSAM
jgi:glycosyltransferase involved in cell wall biosynthesis